MVPERKWLADKLAGKISKINRPTDVNAKMILFTSALNVFMVQTLELDNIIQDYFNETITNFKLYMRRVVILVCKKLSMKRKIPCQG